MKCNGIQQNRKSYEGIGNEIIKVLFFLILFAPTVMKYVKAIPLLILSVLVLAIVVKYKKIYIDIRIVLWVLIYSGMDFLFLLRGTFGDVSVLRQLFPVYVLWPFLYLGTVVAISGKSKELDFSNFFVFVTICIEGYLFYIYLNFLKILPNTFLLKIQTGYSINYNFNYINFFAPCISSLFFLLPYIVVMLITTKRRKGYRALLGLVLCMGIYLSIIIGRRALIAVIFISPIIYLFIKKYTHKGTMCVERKAKKIKMIIAIILACAVLGILLIVVANNSQIGLRLQNLDTDLIKNGTSVRTQQFQSLMRGWEKNPYFGAGLGVNTELIRSAVPGTYELSYIARLFQTGIIGISIYAVLILWLIYKLMIIAKKCEGKAKYILPFLAGLTSVLLAEFTNPYMNSFDGLWIIFYALAIINNDIVGKQFKAKRGINVKY